MQTRQTLHASILTGSLALLFGVTLMSSPAQAGFQWVPSADQPAASAPVAQAPTAPAPVLAAPSPVLSPMPEMPAPLVIEGTNAPPPPASAPDADLAKGEAPQPSVSLPTSPSEVERESPATVDAKASSHFLVLPPSAATSSAPGETAQEKPVRGFANGVPLTVALRQILPPDYGFSIAQDVSPSSLVSWHGGAGWRETLQAMLQTIGLGMEEKGNLIRIVHGAGAAQPSTDAATAPAPEVAPAPASGGEEMSPALARSGEKPLPLTPPPAGKSGTPSSDATAGGSFLKPPPAFAEESVTRDKGSDLADSAPRSAASVDSWTADRGETLHRILENWSRRAGVELSWLAEYDYPIQATVSFTGTFQDAVRDILAGFQEAHPQPIGVLHNAQAAGQDILVISARGNNYND
jgi:hypothetical protein